MKKMCLGWWFKKKEWDFPKKKKKKKFSIEIKNWIEIKVKM